MATLAPPRKIVMSETQDVEPGEVLADEPVYVISVAAKLAALPSWTLRVLDKQGIVSPQRTEKDRRLYSDRDIAKLARVRYLTEECGVNINGVKLILEMEERGMQAAKQHPDDGGETV